MLKQLVEILELKILRLKKMTSKQKRALEKNQKRKKIGSNFYEVANVKNRNRKKKKLG